MSGTFDTEDGEINVPPTLVSFAVAPLSVKSVTSSEFKGSGNLVFWLKPKYDENHMPDFDSLKALYDMVYLMLHDTKVKLVRSAWAVGGGGVMEDGIRQQNRIYLYGMLR